MTDTQFDEFSAAVERDLRDGAKAEFTEAELAAMRIFDELLARRPDIAALESRRGLNGHAHDAGARERILGKLAAVRAAHEAAGLAYDCDVPEEVEAPIRAFFAERYGI